MKKRSKIFTLIVIYILSGTIIFQGIYSLIHIDYQYENVWGGRLFGPFTICIAILIASGFTIILLKKEKRLTKREKKKQNRRIHFPSDDIPMGK